MPAAWQMSAVVVSANPLGLADPGLLIRACPMRRPHVGVLTLTDSFLGRGYPEPDRDKAAAVDAAQEMIARVLRRA